MDGDENIKENVWLHKIEVLMELDDDGSVKIVEHKVPTPRRKVLLEKYKIVEFDMGIYHPSINRISLYGEGGLKSNEKSKTTEATLFWGKNRT